MVETNNPQTPPVQTSNNEPQRRNAPRNADTAQTEEQRVAQQQQRDAAAKQKQDVAQRNL